MSVQINDCTIRDGGYLFGKDSPCEFVHAVVDGLLGAGVDAMEIGFLQDVVGNETVVYGDSEGARGFIPKGESPYRFTGFCDNSRYSLSSLDDFTGLSFGYLKISFAKHEWRPALEFAAGAKGKGYMVFANPMDAPSYTQEERSEMIAAVNEICPYCFSIVDTFGTMYLDDLEKVFSQMDAELDPSIRIGLHSHNNLDLSTALAERMIDLSYAAGRDVVVDSSLYGMGRGAGNASTEAVAAFLNSRYGAKYELGVLFDVIERWLVPAKATRPWGYTLPMLACGIMGSHVDNVSHILVKRGDVPASEVLETLSKLSPGARKRYGSGYSKTEFAELDRVLGPSVMAGGGK